MLETLLWIIGTYAACMLVVHCAHAWYVRQPEQSPKHIVLITHNQQHQVEWVLRALIFISWLKGRDIRITLLDYGSSDHTLNIAERLAFKTPFVWRSVASESELRAMMAEYSCTAAVVVDVNRKEEVRHLLCW